MRIAWFSPMLPARTGVAVCSEELVPHLARDHQVDAYVDEDVATARRAAPAAAAESRDWNLYPAHDFPWRHRQTPYDLVVYQLGNSARHDYLWPYLFRYPGLAVLHDVHLHHARAALLMRQRRADDYRAEFAAMSPSSSDAAELAVAGFDSQLLYEWPFTGLVVAASRMTAVHTGPLRDQLRAACPEARIEQIRLGHGVLLDAADVAARGGAARRQLGIPDRSVVFGVFGGLTPEKRISRILETFEAILPYVHSAHLLLAGAPADHYDVEAAVRRPALDGRVTVTGYLDSDDALTGCIAASDVTLNLRWPTAREVSGPWLRCLAAGRASVVTDLAHTADVPALDPRTWTCTAAGTAAPVTVAIDLQDETHSLFLAMRRLAQDSALRDAIGTAARAYWKQEHAPEVMVEDYRRLLPAAAAAPVPVRDALPGHLRQDGSRRLTALLEPFGTPVPWSTM